MKYLKTYEGYWSNKFNELKNKIKIEYGDIIKDNIDDQEKLKKMLDDIIFKKFYTYNWMDIDDALKSVIKEYTQVN